MYYIQIIWFLILIFWTVILFIKSNNFDKRKHISNTPKVTKQEFLKIKKSLGWVNFYLNSNQKIHISNIPKGTKKEAIASGLTNKAKSKYLGTFKIYK